MAAQDIEKVAEQFADMKVAKAGLVMESNLVHDIAKATAIEVLEYALPRLGGDPGE